MGTVISTGFCLLQYPQQLEGCLAVVDNACLLLNELVKNIVLDIFSVFLKHLFLKNV